jgi:aminodeoxyfutalosine synthase
MSSTFKQIQDKVLNSQRLNQEEGEFLFNYPDLLSLGQLANVVRERIHRDVTYYNRNLHLNATNVCEADCLFCSFARLEAGMPQAVTMTLDEALSWISKRYSPGMTEIHIVNGLDPNLPFSYYEELLSRISAEYPDLHIKAFTAVEIHYFAEKFGMDYKEILERLIQVGLGSLPGGGAEIFADRVRKKICRDKVDAVGWLSVHRTAHMMGLKSNCTMLYGTIERIDERVDHLIRLRTLQEETAGFQAFIPLAFHPENNRLGKLEAPTTAEDLRVMAVSRLILDNISNIKAYWVMLSVQTAQIAQLFGANDIDGTVVEEKIYHMAGARTPNQLSVLELKRIIEAVGRRPVERTTTYEVVSSREVQSACV